MSETDILILDSEINKNFASESQKLDSYKNELDELIKSLEVPKLSFRIKKSINKKIEMLTQKIEDIENNTSLNLYNAQTAQILEEYKKILKIPIKMNFMGKPMHDDTKKNELINKYLNIVNPFLIKEPNIQPIVCNDCNNKKDFEIEDGNVYICMKCFSEQTFTNQNSSYTDINRVNIASKFMYERKIHFRDCLKQYQGNSLCSLFFNTSSISSFIQLFSFIKKIFFL